MFQSQSVAAEFDRVVSRAELTVFGPVRDVKVDPLFGRRKLEVTTVSSKKRLLGKLKR